jgi:hypothetical protein
MIREFLKTIQIKYDQIVRFIKMNDERTLKFEYREFMKLRKIVTKRFTSYTSFQNDKIERSENVLMIKTRVMRIKANLSANMKSKIFKLVNYLNNRIFKRALNWKTSFKILTKKKFEFSTSTIVRMLSISFKEYHLQKESIEIENFYWLFCQIRLHKYLSNLNI